MLGDLPGIVSDRTKRRRRVLTNVNRKSYSADTLFLLPVLFVLTLFPFPSVSQRTAEVLFPPSRPFPDPINSSCFSGQNNSLHAFPFMHSWHRAETSPPTACYYLTHAPACLLDVYKVAPRHTHTPANTPSHIHTHPSAQCFFFCNNHNKSKCLFSSKFADGAAVKEKMCKMFQVQVQDLTCEILSLRLKLFD